MDGFVPASQYAIARRVPRETVVREIVLGRVRGVRAEENGRYYVAIEELEQLAAGSGAMAEIDLGVVLGR
jgi:hypothetical protein